MAGYYRIMHDFSFFPSSDTVKVEELSDDVSVLQENVESCRENVKSGDGDEPCDKVIEPECDVLKYPSISVPSAKSTKKSKFPDQTSMPKISIKKFITNTLTRMSKTKKKKIAQPVACSAM